MKSKNDGEMKLLIDEVCAFKKTDNENDVLLLKLKEENEYTREKLEDPERTNEELREYVLVPTCGGRGGMFSSKL